MSGAVISALVLFAAAGVATRISGGLLSAPALAVAAWIPPTIAAALFGVDLNGAGAIVVAGFSLAMALGHLLGHRFEAGRERRRLPETQPAMTRPNGRRLVAGLAAGPVAAATAAMLFVRSVDRSLSSLLSFEELADTSNSISVARYAGDQSVGILGLVALLTLYSSTTLAGILKATLGERLNPWASIAGVMSAWVLALITTTRSLGLLATVLFGAGYLMGRTFNERGLPALNASLIRRLAAGTAVVIVFAFSASFLRLGAPADNSVGIALDKSRSVVVLGSIGNDRWASGALGFPVEDTIHPAPAQPVSFAAVTGPLLGAPGGGVYEGLNRMETPVAATSNLYGAWRGLGDDFGLAAIVVVSMFGFISGLAAKRVVTAARLPVVAGGVAISATAWALYTPVVSTLLYTTVAVAPFVATWSARRILTDTPVGPRTLEPAAVAK